MQPYIFSLARNPDWVHVKTLAAILYPVGKMHSSEIGQMNAVEEIIRKDPKLRHATVYPKPIYQYDNAGRHVSDLYRNHPIPSYFILN